MLRRLFTLASAVSLLLCLATGALWVRSCWVDDFISWDKYAWYWQSGGGQAYLSHGYLGKRSPVGGFTHESSDRTSSAKEMSFSIDVNRRSPSMFWIEFHFIGPAVLSALLPAGYLLLLWRATRHKMIGVCPTCSYNLTGNTSGICPECGTSVAGKGT